ncbi:GGDEF domain-containing protein [Diaphorobacter sp. HDW4A]|uniref:GGDEF domain-containing protein n=1 Tax=Diaphorobacter sp. HDW4A TaxID=2714924 RepID=UPI00140E1EA1|nr:GGDEF domain-containing protein [Diaphorobacter sp. HDW4A]QIL82266.1 GGDEF domain-containing protein [Diaphorobacter sp. HDW4A]
MPSASRAALQRFLYGDPVHAEDESLLAFQHRFLISIALSAVVFNLALIAVFCVTSAGADFLAFVVICWGCAIVANLLLWRWLRAHPRRIQLGSLLTATLFWLTLCTAGMALPPDPLLPMWSMLLIVGVFMMTGRVWGWVAFAVAIASSHFLLSRVDLTAFPNAVLTVWFTSAASAVLGHIYVSRFDHFFNRMAYYNERLLWLSTHDGLTSTLNAAAFYEQCNRQLALCRRHQLNYAVLFVDLDHFKYVNDNYGHATGDGVLVQVAQILRGCLRESDQLGRVGGEEFSIFLTDPTLDGCNAVAERIRASIEAQEMHFDGHSLHVTASIGLTWSSAGDTAVATIHQIQPLADKAMYEAKRAGRNQVAAFG